MIEIKNPKIIKFLTDKDALVVEGKNFTKEIERIDIKIKGFENKEKAITGKIKPTKEVEEKGDKLVAEINARVKELEQLGKEIEESKLAAIPADMRKEHEELMASKEKLERERNKIALKIQKIKDRVIPMIQKECKPHLATEFDDIETAKLIDGKVVVTTFNHIDDFKAKFRKR